MAQSLELPIPDDYVPSEGELNNFVYLICKYSANWAMRAADLQICLLMADEIKGNKGLTNLCEVTCEYVWDHICGEPDEISSEKLFEHMKPILHTWYTNTTPEERAITT